MSEATAVLAELFRLKGRSPGFRDISRAVLRSFEAIDLVERQDELTGHPDGMSDAQIILQLSFDEYGASELIRKSVRILKESGVLSN